MSNDRSIRVIDHEAAKVKTAAMLRDLWQRKLPMVREHLHQVERAAAMLETGRLTGLLRTDAAIAAHKLAGSLGMFGFPEGTRFARELEHLLDAEGEPPPATFALLLDRLRGALPLDGGDRA